MYKCRNIIGILLLLFSGASFLINYSNSLESAIGTFLAQVWTGQAVYQYARHGRVSIGPGGLDKDANPYGRATLAFVSFLLYLLFFVPAGAWYGL